MKICIDFFLLLFAINLTGYTCQQVSLIGSRFLSSPSNYEAFLIKHSLSEGSVTKVELSQSNSSWNSASETIEFNVPSERRSNYELKITSSIQSNCPSENPSSIELMKTSDTPIVFIHFNKPIYKTNEDLTFRVFVLNSELIPYAGRRDLKIIFFDQDNKTVESKIELVVDDYGVYNKTIAISTLIEKGFKPGLWRIQAEVGGKKVSKSFEVHAYNQGQSELFVETQAEVAFADRKIYMNIFTKDATRKNIGIYFVAKFENSGVSSISKWLNDVQTNDVKTTVYYDFQEDLGIKYPTSDMDLIFTIQVDESNPTVVTKKVKLRHKGRNTIQIIKKKYFKPGFKYPIKVRVKTMDGKPDNSLNQLLATVKYMSNETDLQTRKAKFEEKKYQTNLKNGETVYSLQPKVNTNKIEITLEFGDTKITKEFNKFPGVEEYMSVSMLNKSSTVGSKVQIGVQASNEMEELHLLVFGSQGIIYNENFEDAIDKDIFNFTLELTEEMKPEARGLVFYSRQSDGAIIYDEFSLNLGFTIDNSLDINAPDKAEPNEIVNIEIKTEKDAMVYLVAIDANSALINRDNEITRNDIYNELAYYMNRKFPNPKGYHFEKLNAFILEPVKNGKSCEFGTRLGTRFSGETDDENESQQTLPADYTPQKYFPEVILEKIYNAQTNETEKVQIQVPDKTTTWRIYGISVHKTKGLTVAKTQPEITVKSAKKQELIQLKFSAPESVKLGDIFEVELDVLNYDKIPFNQYVLISIENGTLQEEKQVNENRRRCLKYYNRNSQSFQFRTNIEKIYVYAENLERIKLRASAQIQGQTFKDEITINVIKSLTYNRKKVLQNRLIDSPNYYKTRYNYDQNSQTLVNNYVSIHSNLLGPALNGLGSLFKRPMILDEDKVAKFGVAVINAKYLKFAQLTNNIKYNNAINEINVGYSELVQILRDILKTKAPKSTWLASFITQNLIDAKPFIDNQNELSTIIDESLDFIKDQNIQTGGRYYYDKDSDYRRDMGPEGSREILQAALITSVLVKYDLIKFQSEISSTKVYLETRHPEEKKLGDPVKTAVSYMYALNNDIDLSKTMITKMGYGYKSANRHPKHSSLYVESLSYMIQSKIISNSIDLREDLEWLLIYRNPDGDFHSPYHTYLALKALYEYIIYFKFVPNDMRVRLNQDSYDVNALESRTLPIFRNEVTLEAINIPTRSLGYSSAYYEYNNTYAERNPIFSIIPQAIKISKNQGLVSLKLTNNLQKLTLDGNLMTLEVEMPSGYKYENFTGNLEIEKTWISEDQSLVIFIIKKMVTKYEYNFDINIKKIADIKKPSLSMVKFYDYYRPDFHDISWYRIGSTDIFC